MSYYDDASLVVIPSGYKTSKVYAEKPTDGSGDLAFTRTGDTATRVNSAGLIDKVRTNLVLQSQALDNASWGKTTSGGTITVTANYGTAPDGTTTADRIQLSAPSPGTYADVLQVVSLTSGRPTTYSIYLKALSGTPTIMFFNDGATGNKQVTLTSDWVRYTFTVQSSGSLSYPRFLCDNPYTSSSADFLAWGAQLEYSDIATDYIPTTTAAVSVGPVANVPRLDYLNSSCPRLLLEPQRTNVALNSETFGSSTGTTIVLNNGTSPDGYVNADKLVEDTSTGVHISTIGGVVGGSVDSSVYSVSFFAKDAGRTRINVFDNNQATSGSTNFDISNGVVISGSGRIENYGNGWYRCIIFPAKTNSTTSNCQIRLIDSGTNVSYTGNGTSGVFLWGKQVEAGAYATSYIPTLAASATRGADACSKTGISSLIGQTQGTLFVDYNYQVKPDASGNIPIVIVSGSNEAYIYITNAGALRFELYNAGVLQSLITGTIGAAGGKKIAFAYKANDFVGYMNGVQIGTDTSGTVGAMAALHVGSYYTSDYSTVSGINQALLFPTRLTNSELASLTSL